MDGWLSSLMGRLGQIFVKRISVFGTNFRRVGVPLTRTKTIRNVRIGLCRDGSVRIVQQTLHTKQKPVASWLFFIGGCSRMDQNDDAKHSRIDHHRPQTHQRVIRVCELQSSRSDPIIDLH